LNRGRRRNTKILVVDDDLLLASLLQMVLEDEGYEARSAGDGIEGYARYLLFRPEVVITDLHMPGADGVEMMKNIREQDPWVKVIYMSGDHLSFFSVLNEEKRKYPVLILPKPFSREDLLNRLAELRNGGKHRCLLDTPESRRMAE